MAVVSDPSRAEFDACRSDLIRFINHHCVIDDVHGQETTGDGGTRPFVLWPVQEELAQRLGCERLLVILKARQLGISWLVCAYVLHLCLMHPGKVVLLFSQGQMEAEELLRRVAVLYDRLGVGFRAAGPALKKGNTGVLAWSNESRIESLPATQRAGRSFTASLVVMDEAAHMQYGGRLFNAAKPTMADGGQLIVLSTANGVGGMFHTLWTRAVAGLNRFATAFLSWKARPDRDQAWYDRQVEEAADPGLIPQEYPNNPTEAFLVSGRVRFQPAWIAAQAANIQPGLPESAWPEEFRGIDGLVVFQTPGPSIGRLPSFVLSADVAEGLEGGDYSTSPLFAVARNGSRIEELACLHGRWEPDEFAERLAIMAEAYDATILVERNNHGHAVLSKLRSLCPDRILDGPDGRPGWSTTSTTKPQAIDGLAVALRDGTAIVRSQATLDEMQVYRLLSAGRTGAPEGFHDDRVMSWAIFFGQQALALPGPSAPVRTRSPLAGFRGTR